MGFWLKGVVKLTHRVVFEGGGSEKRGLRAQFEDNVTPVGCEGEKSVQQRTGPLTGPLIFRVHNPTPRRCGEEWEF